MAFWTYLLLCRDGSFYTGHTDNLEARMAAHTDGTFPGYTHRRRPVVLVWSQDFTTRDEAFRVERQIKGWSRAKKQALASGDWEALKRLRTPPSSPPRTTSTTRSP
ncbi:MAG: GIY-YIG nuclease family protein [Dehalococcoidia bacterium]|nr:GIY-YIG nuclease family protein [Dehalococcoidia bacterium]